MRRSSLVLTVLALAWVGCSAISATDPTGWGGATSALTPARAFATAGHRCATRRAQTQAPPPTGVRTCPTRARLRARSATIASTTTATRSSTSATRTALRPRSRLLHDAGHARARHARARLDRGALRRHDVGVPHAEPRSYPTSSTRCACPPTETCTSTPSAARSTPC